MLFVSEKSWNLSAVSIAVILTTYLIIIPFCSSAKGGSQVSKAERDVVATASKFCG